MKRLALLLWIASAAFAQTRSITIEQYIATLQLMSKTEAAAIAGAEVISPRGRFHVDDSLLAAIVDARVADPALLARVELTIAELRSAGASGAAPDPKLLQQVAAEQDVPELARGGEVASPVVPDTPLLERIATSIAEMFRWIGKQIMKLIEWLLDFFPHSRPEVPGATTGMRWIVIAVVTLIVIVLIILAVEVVRRARRGAAQTITSTAPLRSTRDADPLSRGATEWERYAMQLASKGRFREAIRAWYHAVLVTCYAAGALHFRKGRTNWEYIASLSPSIAWRSDLIRLTRRFEQEWYGSDESSADALEECSTLARNILDAVEHYERGAA